MLNLTADPEQVKHLLIAARDELQTRGWMQGDYGTIDGPKCTVGAIAWADHADVIPGSRAAELDAAYVMGKSTGNPFVPSWNDDARREGREVIAAFNSAIALVDEEIARRAAVARVQSIAHLAGIEVMP
jgi:hypothetical protein